MGAGSRILGVFAHPDDETFCAGGAFARYAREGAEILVVSATRGQAGQIRDASVGNRRTIGAVREAELRAACAHLGVTEVRVWEHLDGALQQADFAGLVSQVVEVIREFRPDVVITFGPDGGYGHPDHITISAATTQACRVVDDVTLYHAAFPPHDVLLLEYLAQWLTSQPERFTGTLDYAHSMMLMAEEAGTMGFIRDSSQVHWYPPGCIVVEQGETGQELYLILSGRVDVWKEDEAGVRTKVNTLGPGAFFGELGVATKHVRNADVIAAEGLTCLVLAPTAPTLFAGRGANAVLVGGDDGLTARKASADSPVEVTAQLDVTDTIGPKVAALAEYRSQFPFDPNDYPDVLLTALFGQEYFVQAHPPLAPLPDLL